MTHRILLVTENPPLGDVLQDRLRQAGMQALAASPGSALDRIARWGHPDLVVWDIPAPPAEGSAAAASALLKAFRKPPAFLLLGLPGATARALPGGLLLPRPLDFETLLDAVQQLLAETKREGGEEEAPASALRDLTADVTLGGNARRLSPGRQSVRLLTLDLNGLTFESPTGFEIGTPIVLWMPVPGDAGRLRLPAEVGFSRREGGKSVVGCRFTALSSADLARLDRILDVHAQP